MLSPKQQQQQSANESRKRKLSTPVDEGVPAAKHNRRSESAKKIDEKVPVIDLMANESMEASVDLNIKPSTNDEKRKSLQFGAENNSDASDSNKKNGQTNGDDKNEDNDMEGDDDSKENSMVVIDSGTEDNDVDKEDAIKSPKAKKCLDMNGSNDGESGGLRKSKRIRDEGKIMIKLPMPKRGAARKAKQAAAKTALDESVDEKNQSVVSNADSEAEQTDADTSILNASMASVGDSVNLNESSASLSATPKQNMTPKQLARLAESEKKNQEKQRAREERERRLQEEKLQKQLEKEQKEEQRKREKEEKEKKRLAEIEAKVSFTHIYFD